MASLDALLRLLCTLFCHLLGLRKKVFSKQNKITSRVIWIPCEQYEVEWQLALTSLLTWKVIGEKNGPFISIYHWSHFLATLNCKMTSYESCASSCSKNKWQPRQSTLLLDFWWTNKTDQRTKTTQNWSFFSPVISSGIWMNLETFKVINKNVTCSQNVRAKVQSIPSC